VLPPAQVFYFNGQALHIDIVHALSKFKNTLFSLGTYTYERQDIIQISEGIAEASQIFLRDAHVLPKLLSVEEYCRRDRW
jgi:hypothetical protein